MIIPKHRNYRYKVVVRSWLNIKPLRECNSIEEFVTQKPQMSMCYRRPCARIPRARITYAPNVEQFDPLVQEDIVEAPQISKLDMLKSSIGDSNAMVRLGTDTMTMINTFISQFRIIPNLALINAIIDSKTIPSRLNNIYALYKNVNPNTIIASKDFIMKNMPQFTTLIDLAKRIRSRIVSGDDNITDAIPDIEKEQLQNMQPVLTDGVFSLEEAASEPESVLKFFPDGIASYLRENVHILHIIIVAVLFLAGMLGLATNMKTMSFVSFTSSMVALAALIKSRDIIFKDLYNAYESVVEGLYGLLGIDYVAPAMRPFVKLFDRINALEKKTAQLKLQMFNNVYAISNLPALVELEKSYDTLSREYDTLLATAKQTSPAWQQKLIAISSTIELCKETINTLYSSLSGKQTPARLWIGGPAGVGKTHILNTLVSRLSKLSGKVLSVYTENLADAYDTGYVGQDVYTIDDILMDKEGRDLAKWTRYATSEANSMSGAAVYDKGKKFTSQYMMTTSNYLYPIDLPKGMNPAAMYRRRDVLICAVNQAACQFFVDNKGMAPPPQWWNDNPTKYYLMNQMYGSEDLASFTPPTYDNISMNHEAVIAEVTLDQVANMLYQKQLEFYDQYLDMLEAHGLPTKMGIALPPRIPYDLSCYHIGKRDVEWLTEWTRLPNDERAKMRNAINGRSNLGSPPSSSEATDSSADSVPREFKICAQTPSQYRVVATSGTDFVKVMDCALQSVLAYADHAGLGENLKHTFTAAFDRLIAENPEYVEECMVTNLGMFAYLRGLKRVYPTQLHSLRYINITQYATVLYDLDQDDMDGCVYNYQKNAEYIIMLDKNHYTCKFVPIQCTNINEALQNVLPIVETSHSKRRAVMLIGDPGVGKTYWLKQAAQQCVEYDWLQPTSQLAQYTEKVILLDDFCNDVDRLATAMTVINSYSIGKVPCKAIVLTGNPNALIKYTVGGVIQHVPVNTTENFLMIQRRCIAFTLTFNMGSLSAMRHMLSKTRNMSTAQLIQHYRDTDQHAKLSKYLKIEGENEGLWYIADKQGVDFVVTPTYTTFGTILRQAIDACLDDAEVIQTIEDFSGPPPSHVDLKAQITRTWDDLFLHMKDLSIGGIVKDISLYEYVNDKYVKLSPVLAMMKYAGNIKALTGIQAFGKPSVFVRAFNERALEVPHQLPTLMLSTTDQSIVFSTFEEDSKHFMLAYLVDKNDHRRILIENGKLYINENEIVVNNANKKYIQALSLTHVSGDIVHTSLEEDMERMKQRLFFGFTIEEIVNAMLSLTETIVNVTSITGFLKSIFGSSPSELKEVSLADSYANMHSRPNTRYVPEKKKNYEDDDNETPYDSASDSHRSGGWASRCDSDVPSNHSYDNLDQKVLFARDRANRSTTTSHTSSTYSGPPVRHYENEFAVAPVDHGAQRTAQRIAQGDDDGSRDIVYSHGQKMFAKPRNQTHKGRRHAHRRRREALETEAEVIACDKEMATQMIGIPAYERKCIRFADIVLEKLVTPKEGTLVYRKSRAEFGIWSSGCIFFMLESPANRFTLVPESFAADGEWAEVNTNNFPIMMRYGNRTIEKRAVALGQSPWEQRYQVSQMLIKNMLSKTFDTEHDLNTVWAFAIAYGVPLDFAASTLHPELIDAMIKEWQTPFPMNVIKYVNNTLNYPLQNASVKEVQEGMQDPPSLITVDAMFGNQIPIVHRIHKSHLVYGLALKENLVLSVRHVNTMPLSIWDHRTSQYYDLDFIRDSGNSKVDLAIYRIVDNTCQAFSDITNHITDPTEFKQFVVASRAKFPIMLVRPNMAEKTRQQTVIHSVCDTLYEQTDAYNPRTMKYGVMSSLGVASGISVAGHCGSVVVAQIPQLRGKIIGIHFAGSSTTSVSTWIDREYINSLIRGDIEKPESLGIVPHPSVVHADVAYLDERTNLMVTGKIIDPVFIPNKNAKYQTGIDVVSIAEKCGTPVTIGEPAALTPKDPRIEGTEIYFDAIAGYSQETDTTLLNEDDLNETMMEIANYISNVQLRNKQYTRLLTTTEVINGGSPAEFPKYNSIDRTGSSGFGWMKPGKAKKGDYFELRNGLWRYRSDDVIVAALLKRINRMEKDAANGIQHESPMIAYLKDEIVALKKIYDVTKRKTRVFFSACLDHLVLMRKYTGAVVAHCAQNWDILPPKIGISNSYMDALKFCTRHLAVGPSGFASDMKNFDKTIPALYQECTMKMWNEVYRRCSRPGEWETTHDVIRNVLNQAYTYTTIIVGGKTCRLTQAQPSGNPLTAINNSVFVWAAYAMAYKRLAKIHAPREATFTHFMKNVCLSIYGDDNMCTVHPSITKWFNFGTFKPVMDKLGFIVTDAAKSGDVVPDLQPFHELEFLKRTFTQVQGHWVMKLQLDSIAKAMAWTQQRPSYAVADLPVIEGKIQWPISDNEDVIVPTVSDCFDALALHGEAIFNQWRDELIASDTQFTFNIKTWKETMQSLGYNVSSVYN